MSDPNKHTNKHLVTEWEQTELYHVLGLRQAETQRIFHSSCWLWRQLVLWLQWITIIWFTLVLIPKNSALLRCPNALFCDAKSEIWTIRTDAAQRAANLGSFQTHLQGNATLPSAAVSTHLRWDRCSTKGAHDSAPAPTQPRSSINVTFVNLSQEQMARGRPGLSSTWLCFSLIHSI